MEAGVKATVDREARLAGLTAWHALPPADFQGKRRPRPILFVHGMWEAAWVWETWLPFFAARGWEGWAIDLRGHGRSQPVSGRFSIHDYVEDARRAAETLAEAGPAPILVGHSMGGLLVEKLAEVLDPPATVAVTPAAPRGFFAIQTPELLKGVLHHLHQILFWRPVAQTRKEAVALELNRLPPDAQDRAFALMQPESGRQAFELAVFGLPVDPGRITAPLLLVAGTDDRITPSKLQRKVARRLGAGYREYERHAHMIGIEPGWERVAGEVAEWVEEQAGAR